MGWTEDEMRAYLVKRSTAAEDRRLGTEVAPTSARGASAPSKYRNQRCSWNGDVFDSKWEMEQYILLKARETAGEITDLQRQVPFPLHCPIMCGREHAHAEVCRYVADFTYRDRANALHVLDAKGVRTRMFQLKAKWLALEHGIVVELL